MSNEDMHVLTFGERLRMLRVARGFQTQSALAATSGVAQSLISDLESGGVQTPGMETLQRLSRCLESTVDDLVKGPQYLAVRTTMLSWFWTTRLSTLSDAQRLPLQSSTTKRTTWCFRQLVYAFHDGILAKWLDIPPEDVHRIATARMRPRPDVQTILVEQALVPADFLETGSPANGDNDLKKLLVHPDSDTYLQVIYEAMQANVSPALLQKALGLLLLARHHEP